MSDTTERFKVWINVEQIESSGEGDSYDETYQNLDRTPLAIGVFATEREAVQRLLLLGALFADADGISDQERRDLAELLTANVNAATGGQS